MKNFLLTLFFLISFALNSQVPTLGLIGGWPFTGNANDMSGSGNNGTVYNAALTADRFGNANSAYTFNGTSSYIQMLSAGPTGTVSRSVSFWAKTTNTLIQVGFNYGDAGNSGIYQILFNYNCQGVGVDNSNSALIRGNNTLANNQWHHIVAVYNSTVGSTIGSVDLYVDAVLQPSISCFVTSTNSPITSNNVYPIAIGRSSNSSARFFYGDLDDFYFYNRPLTYNEVQNLYNFSPCSSGPPAPSAILGSTNICLGTTNIYSVTPVTGATSYIWNLPGGWSGASTSNIISTTANISGGVISVAAQNPCGMSGFNALNINAIGSPTMNVTGNLNICIGNNTSLMATGANTYSWSNGVTTANIIVSPTVTTSYTVTGTNSANCSSSVIKTVNVSSNIAPVISVAGPGQSCQGQIINLASNGAN
ncbi:MAG: LamG-like jellyroll fold domain-containing protein, partial [Bacteroidia bacterium]